MHAMTWATRAAMVGVCFVGLFGCDKREATKQKAEVEPTTSTKATPYAPVRIDGSSTVHPISEGVLDLYASRLVTDVELEVSGTGGGFKKFCDKKTDINAASRPITPLEDKVCAEHGVSYVEVPVAFDGVAVVVPIGNDWVDSLSITELKKIWQAEAEGTVLSWRDVRSSFPDRPLHLYGPGIDSGTFDFFTSVINGAAGSSRSDYKSSEDDHELVSQIAEDASALGYFGLSYQQANAQTLKLIAIDDENSENGVEPVIPSAETVAGGQYHPLSRPLFLYVSTQSLDRKEVSDFVDFYLKSARLVAPDIGAVGLTKEIFTLAHDRLRKRKEGSSFHGISSVVGLTLLDLLRTEQEEVTAEAKVGPQLEAKARLRQPEGAHP